MLCTLLTIRGQLLISCGPAHGGVFFNIPQQFFPCGVPRSENGGFASKLHYN
jgi:hypothetical protein